MPRPLEILLAIAMLASVALTWAISEPLPAIDFTSEMAIAVLAGFRPSFGHSVETLRVLHDADAGHGGFETPAKEILAYVMTPHDPRARVL